MKVIGDFNKISDKIKPPKLKVGEIIEYQLLCGVRDVNNPRKIIYPSSFRIPTKDRILDIGTGEYVDIGVYDEARTKAHGSARDGNILTKPIYIRGASGLIGLTGGNVEHQELFEFMELSNENESNPNRDINVIPKYKRIDTIKAATDSSKQRSKRTQALVFVDGLSEKDSRELAAALNWDERDDITVIKNRLGEMAETKPDAFIDFIESPDNKDRALIKYAISKGIINYDPSTHKIMWPTGDTVATLERQDGKSEIAIFGDWLKTAGNGGEVMANIKRKMNNLIKESNKPIIDSK